MDHCSFLKGAAAAGALAPALPAIAATPPPSLFAGTVTFGEIAAGTITASKIALEESYFLLGGAKFLVDHAKATRHADL